MKTIPSVIILFFAFTFMNAQNVDWGVKNLSDNAKYEPSVVQWGEDGLFCFADDNKKYYFEKLDAKTFKSQYRTEFEEPKYGKDKSTLEEVAFVKGNYIAFFSCYNKSDKLYSIYAVEYKGSNGRPTGKDVQIFEAEVEKHKEKGGFLVLVSEDNSKILVNHYAYSKKHNKMNDYYILLNSDLEEITSRTESFDVSKQDYKTSNYVLNNDGTVYFWKNYSDKSSIVSYDGTRDFDKWEEIVTLDARPNSYSIGGAYCFDNNGDFLIAGIWGTKQPKGTKWKDRTWPKIRGSYFFKINAVTKEIEKSVVSEFSKEDAKLLVPSEDEKVYGIGRRMAYTTFNLIPTTDNGVILTGEQYQRVIVHSKNYSSIQTTYGHLFATHIDSEGQALWAKPIPKSQFHAVQLNIITSFFSYKRLLMGCEYFSYTSLVSEDKLHLIFNDHPKNMAITKTTQKMKTLTNNANKSIPVIITFNLTDGSFTKKLYRDIDGKGLYLKPAFSTYDPKTKKTLIFAQKGKEYMFGLLE